MLKHFAIASAIALGSSLAIAPAAKADGPTVDIPFNGSVEFDCQFGEVIPGTLVPEDGIPTYILSSFGEGAPGLTDIICNGAAQIDITQITKISAPDDSICLDPVFDPSVNGEPALPVAPNNPTDLIVNLTVECEEPLVVGDYVYEVTLLAVPD